MVFGSGLQRRLALFVVPFALSVVGPGMAWAESGHGGGRTQEDSPCTNAATSPIPFSLCTTASMVCSCAPKDKPEKPEKPKPS